MSAVYAARDAPRQHQLAAGSGAPYQVSRTVYSAVQPVARAQPAMLASACGKAAKMKSTDGPSSSGGDGDGGGGIRDYSSAPSFPHVDM